MGYLGAKERVAAVAERRHGRISWAQLRELGVAKRTITVWLGSPTYIAYCLTYTPSVIVARTPSRTWWPRSSTRAPARC